MDIRFAVTSFSSFSFEREAKFQDFHYLLSNSIYISFRFHFLIHWPIPGSVLAHAQRPSLLEVISWYLHQQIKHLLVVQLEERDLDAILGVDGLVAAPLAQRRGRPRNVRSTWHVLQR